MLENQGTDAALIYTSDHGEDIFDDPRHLFLHASPVPSYYQLHIPFLIWMSDSYREAYPEHWEAVTANKEKEYFLQQFLLSDDAGLGRNKNSLPG